VKIQTNIECENDSCSSYFIREDFHVSRRASLGAGGLQPAHSSIYGDGKYAPTGWLVFTMLQPLSVAIMSATPGVKDNYEKTENMRFLCSWSCLKVWAEAQDSEGK
jgi:hypothetical protein